MQLRFGSVPEILSTLSTESVLNYVQSFRDHFISPPLTDSSYSNILSKAYTLHPFFRLLLHILPALPLTCTEPVVLSPNMEATLCFPSVDMNLSIKIS